jgi:hypothetical protein
MERKNVRWMTRKRWNYVHRKVMERKNVKVDDEKKIELCRKERNGSVCPTAKKRKGKRMLVERKDKREWLQWVI